MVMKISPIFYMGNKKKLIKKGLIELFPTNINTMIELFGGSSIVSINSNANNYIISDIDNNLVSLYRLFKDKDSDTYKKGLVWIRTSYKEEEDGQTKYKYVQGIPWMRQEDNSYKVIESFG